MLATSVLPVLNVDCAAIGDLRIALTEAINNVSREGSDARSKLVASVEAKQKESTQNVETTLAEAAKSSKANLDAALAKMAQQTKKAESDLDQFKKDTGL